MPIHCRLVNVLTVCYSLRPDLCFTTKLWSSKDGKVTKKDLKSDHKKIISLKADPAMTIIYLDIGDSKNWVLLGFGDAGARSLIKISSAGGSVILICSSCSFMVVKKSLEESHKLSCWRVQSNGLCHWRVKIHKSNYLKDSRK